MATDDSTADDGLHGDTPEQEALRRYKAAYAAVVDKFPQAALQISKKIAALSSAQTQTDNDDPFTQGVS